MNIRKLFNPAAISLTLRKLFKPAAISLTLGLAACGGPDIVMTHVDLFGTQAPVSPSQICGKDGYTTYVSSVPAWNIDFSGRAPVGDNFKIVGSAAKNYPSDHGIIVGRDRPQGGEAIVRWACNPQEQQQKSEQPYRRFSITPYTYVEPK